MSDLRADYLIVGGGIAGVTCAETLCQLCSDDHDHEDKRSSSILLVTASPAVKRVTNLSMVTERLAAFDVVEVQPDELEK